MRQVLWLAVVCAVAYAQPSTKTFDMYVIDTEGGHAVLYVAPNGEPLLEASGKSQVRVSANRKRAQTRCRLS